MSQSRSHLASSLQAAREAAGTTQAELARACGLSRATVSRLESGERLGNADTLLKIARALGTTVEDLHAPPPKKRRRRAA